MIQKIYLTMALSSILVFIFLIATTTTEISTTAFVNVSAQEVMPGGDAGMIDGTTNTTGGMTDGKSGENGTANGGQ